MPPAALLVRAAPDADYDCIKPSRSYKIFYDHFFAKASACVEVYKTVTTPSGGFSDLSLDKQLAAVFRALSVQKYFSNVASIKDFILPQGEFICKQLIGLDEKSKKSDNKFIELPVLAALRDESYRQEDLTHAQPRSSTGILGHGILKFMTSPWHSSDFAFTSIFPMQNFGSAKERAKGVRCEGDGRIEEWTISGYEERYLVIWLSTNIVDYDCIKPSSSYKIFHDHFFAKASACVEDYKTVTTSSGGFSDLSMDKQLATILRALSVQKYLSNVVSIKDFILPQGEFICKQLIGLAEKSKKSDNKFIELPVLATLRDESCRQEDLTHAQTRSSG
ncbi:DNA (cytosine-5)-methyltransferase 1 [Forsythia ovata]